MNLVLAWTRKQLHSWLRCRLIVDSEMNFIFQQCPNTPLLGSGVSLHAFMEIQLNKKCLERSPLTESARYKLVSGQTSYKILFGFFNS